MRPIKYVVETRSSDAVIFNMIEPEDPRVAYLLKQKFAFATHGRTKWCDQHPYYDYDNKAFISVALKRLAARGREERACRSAPTKSELRTGHGPRS